MTKATLSATCLSVSAQLAAEQIGKPTSAMQKQHNLKKNEGL